MCSVLGCYSSRVPRFKLPEDPDMRLEWVRFLARVNEQRFKESSWRDISICGDHFESDCFENPLATLKPGAVPSLCFLSEEAEPDDGEDQEEEMSVEATGESGQPGSCSPQSAGACRSPVPSDGPSTSATVSPMRQKHMHFDLITKKAALVKTKGKFVVNEKCLLQLFSSKCPLCGSNLKMERFAKGAFVTVNQQCSQCEYRKEWKSRAGLEGPATEDRYLTVDISPQLQQAAASKATHTVVRQTGDVTEDSDRAGRTEKLSGKVDAGSERSWSGDDDALKAGSPRGSEGDENSDPLLDGAHQQLCADCGVFFSQGHPHVCLHKLKPHSCNFCGRRFVDLMSLRSHNRTRDPAYEQCHVVIQAKPDRPRQKRAPVAGGKPYRCPSCLETFASRMEFSVHAYSHRGGRQFKCNTCGRQFALKNSLKVHATVHTGERPYACSVCQRRFSQAGHLKSHMRLHTGERPYRCQHCDQRFNHNVSLKLHLARYHAGGSGQKGAIETDAVAQKPEKGKEAKAKDPAHKRKRQRPKTGRPKGRPKKNAAEF